MNVNDMQATEEKTIDEPNIYLFVDTETGGFPSRKKELTDDTQPPITQFGAVLRTRDKVISELSILLTVGDRLINPHAAAVNGHSVEQCNALGMAPLMGLYMVHELAIKADVIVCHNYDFDTQMIEMEYARAALGIPEYSAAWDVYKNTPSFCTMNNTIELCGLLNSYDKPKKPKLTELHEFLFGEGFEGAHDALADVKATARCFFDDRVYPFKIDC